MVKLTQLVTLSLTYSEVGATAGELPDGYHHVRESAAIGAGRDRFAAAGDAVMQWGMQRGAGLRVEASSDFAQVGAVLIVYLGPLPAPCRVVYVVDEPNCRGFGYGTLPGHPESGEEFFCVRYDPCNDAVSAEVTAFSRPATWWSKAGGPVTSLAQRQITRRYLRAV